MSNPTTDSQMYQTMHRQPAELRRILDQGWDAAAQAAHLIAGANRIVVTGIGTSYHAAVAGAWLLRAAGADARAISSFDLAVYGASYPLATDDAVIVMAHTGVKTYSAVALERATNAGATVISVGSLAAEHPGSQLVLRTVEREKSAAYTLSHTAAMMVLAQLAIELGTLRGAPVEDLRAALDHLPEQIGAVLDRQDEILPIAELAVAKRVYAAGAGPNEITATELVIKAREAAYGQVDGLALEQFLHGPLVAVNAGDLAVLIAVNGPSHSRVGEVGAVLQAIGADLWIVGQPLPGLDVPTFALPETVEVLSPLLAVVPMQILAYQMAVKKGLNPDTFRRDNPVYKEAIGLLKL
jgi:glucosamine--fructose-6-phosphate aminotransferase (isomerizing)